MRGGWIQGIVGALLAGAAFAATAQSYNFTCISNVNAGNCAIGESQFKVSITENASFADLVFTNQGSGTSSITDIYFDWVTPTDRYTLTDIFNSAGVQFAEGASPSNLPAGGPIGFSANVAADSDSPVVANGVNNGVSNPLESVTFRFAVNGNNVNGDLFSGALRIGIHAQAYADGGSESFIAAPVPEPETWAMLVLGLGMVSAIARRRGAGKNGG